MAPLVAACNAWGVAFAMLIGGFLGWLAHAVKVGMDDHSDRQ